jgi:hypothetical protein
MKEYNKIETIYERDTNGTKKLIEGKYRNETVEYLANNEWEFTEKIDGTNIRVCWDGHKITFSGRTDASSIPAHLVNKLTEIFLNEETEQLFEQKFGDMEVILFGEGYGVKIQNGGNYRSDVGFILFDVLIRGNYQSRESVDDIAKVFGLESVPIVLRGTIQEAVDFVKTFPNSTIGNAKMEGVVGRPKVEMLDRCGHRLIVKIKCRDFEEVK